ncbi:MAG: hypothetical protein FWG31_09670 [Oscillospiraceae bacterium]|nr:hypothetical protein [Oscillospiraceae bacterium]
MTVEETLAAYADRKTARFHMPGHKGVLPPPFDGVAPLDVTELSGTGDLYHEREGAIRASERVMAAHFHARDCFYLTGGATQGIYAMLSAATRPGDTVHVARNCHRAVVNALALLDLRPIWHDNGEWTVDSGQLCIYTSPDYYGNIPPRPRTDGLVLCDAAHGAHLPFCLDDYTPPGNLWVASAHKTLGALGQTAMLFSDRSISAELLREQTAVFGTASPSFVLLASLDAAAVSGGGDWSRVIAFSQTMKEKDKRILQTADPAKLTVVTGDGIGDARRLEEEVGVVCEMADKDNIVFMLSPHNTEEDFNRLETALESIPPRQPPNPQLSTIHYPLSTPMSPHAAFFAQREQVPLAAAEGRIAACAFAPLPPGIPIFAPGERIGKKTLEILAGMCYTEETPIWVVKEEPSRPQGG